MSTWPADALYTPDAAAAAGGKHATYARFASSLEGGPGASAGTTGIAAFDADSFRLTRVEASLMDPHARLLLERTTEAVADARGRLHQPAAAGDSNSAVGGASTGVYVGCMWSTGEHHSCWR